MLKVWAGAALAVLVILASGCTSQTTSNIYYAPEDIQITDISFPNEISDGSPFIVNIKVKNNYPERPDYSTVNLSPWCDFGIYVMGKNLSGHTIEHVDFKPLEDRDVTLSFLPDGNSKDTIFFGAVCFRLNTTYDYEDMKPGETARYPSLSSDLRNKLGNLSFVKYFSDGNEIRINYDPTVPKYNPYPTYPRGTVR